MMAEKIHRYLLTHKKRLIFEGLFFLVACIVIVSCLTLTTRAAGWPSNHEGLSFIYRTEIYASHFKHGDIFPVWSSTDAYSMGTPLPLFYQKFFYYMSGFILLITGSLKLSIIVCLAIFMLIGICGIRFCLRKFTNEHLVLLLVPPIFLLSNYAFTDWLVRGAMAEFSAFMLMPWLLWWCLKLIIDKEFSLSIVIILFLLINAHNITAVFSLIPLSLAYLLFLAEERKDGILRTYKKTLFAVGALLALLGPELFLEKLFIKNYDPSKITQAGYIASNNFRPIRDYFSSAGYSWLKNWMQFTVQIDYGLWGPLLIGVLLVLVALIYKRKALGSWYKKHVNSKVVIFLALNLIIFFFLQLTASKPLYLHSHLLQFLQFPWRLLVYVTPLSLLLITYGVTRFKANIYIYTLIVFWLASFIILSPIVKTYQYSFLHFTAFHYKLSPKGDGLGGVLTGIGEYLPRVYKNNVELGAKQTQDIYEELDNTHQTTEVLEGGPCEITTQSSGSFESSQLRFHLSCTSSAVVALPISYNDFSIVRDITRSRLINYSRIVRSDPRIVIDLPGPENTIIEVDLPNTSQVIRKLL